MLSLEEIKQNKVEFLNLIKTIKIDGADIDGLLQYLVESDFFEAPASTMYHCNYAGGLCYHSLNVYKTLVNLVNQYAPNMYDANSLLIVALLHDLSKTNFYEKQVFNKKKYTPNGTKSDNMGKYDWFSEEGYKVKEANERFIGSEHGTNSMFLIGKYIPMTYEESIAVINHHAGLGEARQLYDLSAVMNKYPLVTLLHTADFLATFILERS